jgi:hypothetical protein
MTNLIGQVLTIIGNIGNCHYWGKKKVQMITKDSPARLRKLDVHDNNVVAGRPMFSKPPEKEHIGFEVSVYADEVLNEKGEPIHLRGNPIKVLVFNNSPTIAWISGADRIAEDDVRLHAKLFKGDRVKITGKFNLHEWGEGQVDLQLVPSRKDDIRRMKKLPKISYHELVRMAKSPTREPA